jgi:outer membrane protein assembly factor BamB
LRAVRVEDGVELWRVDPGGDVLLPAVADDLVYVGSAGTLFAVNAHTGDERWRYEIGAFTSLLAVDDKRVYVTGSGHYALDALDAETGELVWPFPADDEPGASSVGGGSVYDSSGDGTLVSVDTRNGVLRGRSTWRLTLPRPPQQLVTASSTLVPFLEANSRP